LLKYAYGIEDKTYLSVLRWLIAANLKKFYSMNIPVIYKAERYMYSEWIT